MKHPLVEIAWLDACTYQGEYDVDEAVRACVLTARTTSGYLIHEGTDVILVAHTRDKDGQVADVSVIPTGWVKSVQPVRKPRTKKVKPE